MKMLSLKDVKGAVSMKWKVFPPGHHSPDRMSQHLRVLSSPADEQLLLLRPGTGPVAALSDHFREAGAHTCTLMQLTMQTVIFSNTNMYHCENSQKTEIQRGPHPVSLLWPIKIKVC